MSDTCETVKIASEATKQGFIIINKSAMKKGDVLFTEEQKEPVEPKEGTKGWLKVQLGNAGVEYDTGANKAELEELYMAIEKVE